MYLSLPRYKDIWNSLLIVYREEVNNMYLYIYNLCFSGVTDTDTVPTASLYLYMEKRDTPGKKGISSYQSLSYYPPAFFCLMTHNHSTWCAELWTTMRVYVSQRCEHLFFKAFPSCLAEFMLISLWGGSFWLALFPSSRRPQGLNTDIGVTSWISGGMAG